MDRIHPNLSPLLPGSVHATEAPHAVGNSDRSLDFRAELRREVRRGHAEEGLDRLATRDPVRRTEKSSREEHDSGVEDRASDARDDHSPLAPKDQPIHSRSEEAGPSDTSIATDEVEDRTDAHDECEQDSAESESQTIPAELPIAMTNSLQKEAAEIAISSELPIPVDASGKPSTAPTASAISAENSNAVTTAEEPVPTLAEPTPQIVVSPLHANSTPRTSSGSADASLTTEDNSSTDQGPIEISEELMGTSANDSLLDDDRPERSSSNGEQLIEDGAKDLEVAADISQVEPALESSEGASSEPRAREAGSTPAVTTSRGAADSPQTDSRSTRSEPQPAQVDPSRFVGRVSRAFESAHLRGGAVQLRLSPPELGAMRIELSVQQGVLSAHLETETAATKSVLVDNLPALRERLAALDIRVERFDIDVRQESTGGQPDWQAQQESRERQEGRPEARPSRGSRPASRESLNEVARPTSPYDATGRFNAIA